MTVQVLQKLFGTVVVLVVLNMSFIIMDYPINHHSEEKIIF